MLRGHKAKETSTKRGQTDGQRAPTCNQCTRMARVCLMGSSAVLLNVTEVGFVRTELHRKTQLPNYTLKVTTPATTPYGNICNTCETKYFDRVELKKNTRSKLVHRTTCIRTKNEQDQEIKVHGSCSHSFPREKKM